MEKGIYTLILRLDSNLDLVVGALGEIHFWRGYYAYTGSARGPGGLKRVVRHLKVMDRSNPARRWHIDYLLPHTTLVDVAVTKTDQDRECQIAEMIGKRLSFVPRFGCTDCKCFSHLHFSQDKKTILEVVKSAHEYLLN
ncbi:MAG: GIY-YIG nuclease family protein [Methanotrichaceae archaeon]